MRLVFACLFCCTSAAAWATTFDCTGKPDGTPCATPCRVDGVCESQRCVGGPALPDGTPCATGSLCTVDDRCDDGECVPGSPRECPGVPCYAASCVPTEGCLYLKTCGDGPSSLGSSDGGAPFVTGSSDGGVVVRILEPDDGGAGDAALGGPAVGAHVHGSGCSLGGRTSGTGFAIWFCPVLYLVFLHSRRTRPR